MTTKSLIPPTINLNGTDAKQLLDQQVEVWRAIDTLQKAMADAAPHGRDYQTRPGEYPSARDAWLQRMQIVAMLKLEIEQHALAIQTQADERRKAS